jgi:Pyruvate-formate lyase
MVFDDCIERGKGVFGGGIRYLGGTLESYGNTNTANSLAAIKKLVYEDKIFTLEQIRQMTKANFVGFEKEQKILLNAPKFGNDDDYADPIRVEVDRHVCTATRDMDKQSRIAFVPDSHYQQQCQHDNGIANGCNPRRAP